MITKELLTESLQAITESASEFRTTQKRLNIYQSSVAEFEAVRFFQNALKQYGFILNDSNIEAVDKIAKHTLTDDKLRGFLLQGSFDTGKTFFTKIYISILNSLKDKSAVYYTANDISRFFRQEKMIINGTEFGLEYLWKYKVIAIDDVGTEAPEVQCFGTKLQPISEIIQQRYDNNKAIWITTNIDQTSFAKVYGERITSRLKEMSYAVVFKGRDLYRGK